jgi:hypothetical protein
MEVQGVWGLGMAWALVLLIKLKQGVVILHEAGWLPSRHP